MLESVYHSQSLSSIFHFQLVVVVSVKRFNGNYSALIFITIIDNIPQGGRKHLGAFFIQVILVVKILSVLYVQIFVLYHVKIIQLVKNNSIPAISPPRIFFLDIEDPSIDFYFFSRYTRPTSVV